MFGWQVGAIVAMFGTFFSNLMSGFSGWAPLVPYYMINMALAVTCFGIATKKFGKVPGIIVGTIVNTLCIAPWPLMMGWAMLIATIIQQVLGSYANCLFGSLAYTASPPRRPAGAMRNRGRGGSAHCGSHARRSGQVKARRYQLPSRERKARSR
jgi:hypothetical protein